MKTKAARMALVQRRNLTEQKRIEAEEKLEKALQFADVKKAYDKYINLTFENAMRDIENNKDIKNAFSSYQKALIKHGLSEKDFEYTPVCPICGDTGKVGGKMCKCLYDDYVECLKKVCEIDVRAPFTFEKSDFNIVADPTQRNQLEKVYAAMKGYAKHLPDVKKRIVVLSGGVGTGKSCLASAVAHEAVENGKSAKVLSAYEFNSLMLKAHTSPIAEREGIMKDVLNADLLVIDDLGVEGITRNVTIEYLLLTIEERGRKNLCTLITTNLDYNRLMDRYGERIYSRLTDKANALFIELKGDDLRRNS